MMLEGINGLRSKRPKPSTNLRLRFARTAMTDPFAALYTKDLPGTCGNWFFDWYLGFGL